MNKCDKCHIKITGSYDYCPLCKNKIVNHDYYKNNVFPIIKPIYEKYHKLFKWLIFISIIICITVVIINSFFRTTTFWALFVIFGFISFWTTTINAINTRTNLMKTILEEEILISVLCLLWDYFTGWHNFSLNYVLPILFPVCIINTYILFLVLKLPRNQVLIYFLFTIILGFVPSIFIMTKIITIIIPSLISIITSLIFLTLLVIFYYKSLKNELTKKFHI